MFSTLFGSNEICFTNTNLNNVLQHWTFSHMVSRVSESRLKIKLLIADLVYLFSPTFLARYKRS